MRSLYQLELPGSQHCIAPAAGGQLAVNGGQVRLNRVHRQAQLIGDLYDRHAGGQETQDGQLALGKRIRQVRGKNQRGLHARLRRRIHAGHGPLGRNGRVPGQQVGEHVPQPNEGHDDLSPGDLDSPDKHLQSAPVIVIQLGDLRTAEQRVYEREPARLRAGGSQYAADAPDGPAPTTRTSNSSGEEGVTLFIRLRPPALDHRGPMETLRAYDLRLAP